MVLALPLLSLPVPGYLLDPLLGWFMRGRQRSASLFCTASLLFVSIGSIFTFYQYSLDSTSTERGVTLPSGLSAARTVSEVEHGDPRTRSLSSTHNSGSTSAPQLPPPPPHYDITG